MVTTAMTRKAAMISPLDAIQNKGYLEFWKRGEIYRFRRNGKFNGGDSSRPIEGFWKSDGKNRFIVSGVVYSTGIQYGESDLRYYRYTYYIADFVKGSRIAPIISLEEKIEIPKQDDLFQKVMGKR